MCLATPMKIIKIKGDKAIVESSGHNHTISIDLIRSAEIGDYVLAHGDMAINKLEPQEAKKILKIIDEKNRTLTKRKGDEKVDGIKLASLYSYNCENAHLYGFSQQLKDFAEGKNSDARKTRHCLKNLDGYKFCEIIAKINEIEDPFDPRVISYYWKGTPDLKGELWHNYTTLIPILKMPIKLIFANMIDECFVHPAQVIESSEQSLLIKYAPVIKTEAKLAVGEEMEKIINGPLCFKAVSNDLITIHYSTAIEKISEDEVQNLQQIIVHSLEKFNARHR